MMITSPPSPSENNFIEKAAAALLAYGIALTGRRVTILKELAGCRSFRDAESIYIGLRNRQISMSRTTVYNTINLLSTLGLIEESFTSTHRSRTCRLFKPILKDKANTKTRIFSKKQTVHVL
jgi:Fe2+ or Zn2+ uptake regulation protein